jgi:uncharacterized protein DUF4279
MDGDGKWSRASLRLFGETLDPDEIGSVLGLEATHTHLKGELFGPGHTARRRESGWLLQSPLSKRSDMIEHLKWLLDTLEPKHMVIRDLAGKYRVDLFCGFGSVNGQGGFTLDATTLTRIAELGVPLALDLYPPGALEISEDRRSTIQ